MNCNSSWTDKQIKQLGMALTFAYKNSDNYGQPLELQSRVDAFKFVLEEDFTVEQILGAIKLHMKQSSEMVKPSHIANMIEPDAPKITTAEFVHAQKEHEKEGFPVFSPHKDVIDAYRRQEEDVREEHAKITDKNALKVLEKFKSKRNNREVTAPNGYKLLTDEDNVMEAE